MPTFGSLFSGIGGLDLGLERAGWECRWQVEIDEFCRKVLAKHWPDVARYGDVRDVAHASSSVPQAHPPDAQQEQTDVLPRNGNLERVDLICGGFPCQPVSVAGKRLGELDERWLWPEFARVLRLLRPRYALIENVPGLFHRGFGRVLTDLHESGFDAGWFSVRASDVGAPHRRERVFIVAYANGETGRKLRQPSDISRDALRMSRDGGEVLAFANGSGRGGWEDDEGEGQTGRGRTEAGGEVLADAENDGLARSGAARPGGNGLTDGGTASGVWSTECRLGIPSHGFSGFLDCGGWECGVPRVTTGQRDRVNRLRGLGNAVVPQVAEYIGKQLLESMKGGEQKADP